MTYHWCGLEERFLLGHTAINERPASSLLLAAVGREDAGNTPTKWLSPHLSELEYENSMIQAHLQSWPWKSQNPIDKVGFENRIPLFMSLALAIASACVFLQVVCVLLLLVCSLVASYAHTEKGHTHMRKTSYLCVLFCNDNSNKGMYSLFLFHSR